MIPAKGKSLENLLSTAVAITHKENPAQITSPYLFVLDMYCPLAIDAIDCGRTMGRISKADWITDICLAV